MHVPNEFPTECINKLAQLFREKDFGGEFVSEVLFLASWFAKRFWDSDDIPPDGVTGDVGSGYDAYCAVMELQESICRKTCETPVDFGLELTNAVLLGILRDTLDMAIKYLKSQDDQASLQLALAALMFVRDLISTKTHD